MRRTTTLAYNGFGELVSSTDALGRVVTFDVDELGRVETRTDKLGAQVQTMRNVVFVSSERQSMGKVRRRHVFVFGCEASPTNHALASLATEMEARAADIEGVPDTAYDLGACMRNVLRAMPIPEEPFREGVKTLKYRRESAKAAQGSLVSSPIVVVVAGVTIVVTELALEAGAYTILFEVTVKVVEKAAEDVAENGWMACRVRGALRCMHDEQCESKGNHWRQTRCGICERRCNIDRSWPSAVGAWDDDGSCEYWQSSWGR